MDWSIVTTVAEPPALVAVFVRHHLQLGALRVHVFLDAPDPLTAAMLRKIPGCEVTPCDHDYWTRLGGRPDQLRTRQMINAQRVYDAPSAEWLAHLDADEFVVDGDPLARALADAPSDCEVVRLPVGERVFVRGETTETIFDGRFRLPAPEQLATRLEGIYGRYGRYLNAGVKGYAHYKSVSRCGRGLRMGAHGPLDLVYHQRRRARFLQRPALLHFDGLTRKSWLLKMIRRARIEDWRKKPNPARARQLRLFSSTRISAASLARFAARLDTVEPATWTAIADAGLAFRPSGTVPRAQAIALSSPADALTPAGFDRAAFTTASGDAVLEAVYNL